MTGALLLLVGCWFACFVGVIVGMATAPLIDDQGWDR